MELSLELGSLDYLVLTGHQNEFPNVQIFGRLTLELRADFSIVSVFFSQLEPSLHEDVSHSYKKLCVQLVLTGEASGEEDQQDGVQGGESAAGEADVEPEDKRSGPEALVADRDWKTSDGTEPEPEISSSSRYLTAGSETRTQTLKSKAPSDLKEKYGVFSQRATFLLLATG